jgi:hypothetical protein
MGFVTASSIQLLLDWHFLTMTFIEATKSVENSLAFVNTDQISIA